MVEADLCDGLRASADAGAETGAGRGVREGEHSCSGKRDGYAAVKNIKHFSDLARPPGEFAVPPSREGPSGATEPDVVVKLLA